MINNIKIADDIDVFKSNIIITDCAKIKQLKEYLNDLLSIDLSGYSSFKDFGDDLYNTLSGISQAHKGRLILEKGFFNIDPNFVQIMKEAGLKWGGSYYDYLHFNLSKNDITSK